MKQSISIFLASLAIAVGSYLGWRAWQPNLTGHWDIVEEQLDEHYISHDWIESLDITNDNVVHLNYDPDTPYPIVGNVNRFTRYMYIGPSCLSLEIYYVPGFDKLHLTLKNQRDPSKPYHLEAFRSIKFGHYLRPE